MKKEKDKTQKAFKTIKDFLEGEGVDPDRVIKSPEYYAQFFKEQSDDDDLKEGCISIKLTSAQVDGLLSLVGRITAFLEARIKSGGEKEGFCDEDLFWLKDIGGNLKIAKTLLNDK